MNENLSVAIIVFKIKQMRTKTILSILGYIFCIMGTFPVFAQNNEEYSDTQVFLITSLSDKNLYLGVPVCFSVRLYSTNPSIDFARPVSRPSFDGFERTRIPMTRTDRYHSVTRENYKGKTYYCVWLEDVVLIPRETGNFTISGEDYIIGLNEYEVFSDPFWGTVRRAVPVEYPVKGEKIKVKVSAIPGKAPSEFSGAVGEFQISVSLPDQTYKGEMQTLLVRISGQGDLSNVELPNLIGQFPSQLGVKSVSQECTTYLEEGVVRSELTFECGFQPLSEGKLTIPSLSFVYFDPLQKKYMTTKSNSIELEVKSGLPSSGKPIYQEI